MNVNAKESNEDAQKDLPKAARQELPMDTPPGAKKAHVKLPGISKHLGCQSHKSVKQPDFLRQKLKRCSNENILETIILA